MTASRALSLPAAAAVALPLIIQGAYLLISRELSSGGPRGDIVAMSVATIAGLASIALLQVPWRWRAALCAIYLPVAFIALGFYSLWFVCSVFDNCL